MLYASDKNVVDVQDVVEAIMEVSTSRRRTVHLSTYFSVDRNSSASSSDRVSPMNASQRQQQGPSLSSEKVESALGALHQLDASYVDDPHIRNKLKEIIGLLGSQKTDFALEKID